MQLKQLLIKIQMLCLALVDEESEVANVASIMFKEQEGAFLAGAAAALMTKSDKIGFVGGMDIPVITRFHAGFVAGVAGC